MPKLVVPSDITLAEEAYSKGPRRVRLLERWGLFCTTPMYHVRYTKNDKNDMRKVLSRKFDAASTDPVVDVLRARQNSIKKKVVSKGIMWEVVDITTLATWYSFRHYDWKTKLIVLPFVAYGASFLGRATGDILTGRNREYMRDRLLGELPAKQYFA